MMKLSLRSPPAPSVEIGERERMSIGIGPVTVVHYEGEIYEGDYDVTPDFTTQTLETAQKIMTDDVTVEPIPVYRTSNPQGGKTIYIGGILDG